MSRRLVLWLPLAAAAALLFIVTLALFRPADRAVRSALVGKPLPEIILPPAVPGKPGLGRGDLASGTPRLLNVFASWCVPCVAEAPQLLRLKAMGVPIDAIAVRDTTPDIEAFLRRYGDPYQRIGSDVASRAQLAIGSSGVPETFVIDGAGRVVLQHVGDIRAEDVPRLAAAIRAAR